MNEKEEKLQKDLKIRLRKIEGQVKGIQGMLDNECCCRDVLTQIAAVRAAINKVGILMIENYARNCMGIDDDKQNEGLENLIKTMNSFIK